MSRLSVVRFLLGEGFLVAERTSAVTPLGVKGLPGRRVAVLLEPGGASFTRWALSPCVPRGSSWGPERDPACAWERGSSCSLSAGSVCTNHQGLIEATTWPSGSGQGLGPSPPASARDAWIRLLDDPTSSVKGRSQT